MKRHSISDLILTAYIKQTFEDISTILMTGDVDISKYGRTYREKVEPIIQNTGSVLTYFNLCVILVDSVDLLIKMEKYVFDKYPEVKEEYYTMDVPTSLYDSHDDGGQNYTELLEYLIYISHKIFYLLQKTSIKGSEWSFSPIDNDYKIFYNLYKEEGKKDNGKN